MKHLLIITGFFLTGSFCVAIPSSKNLEDCDHSTQDTHVVSNISYNRLLASLNKKNEDQKKRLPRESTGQR
ncbi:MAG: hypothetical protein OXC37_01995 [Bdellovibrionaceae bacterium]|nr:hypothetical protein [Pseudobdellovibrionaceae bacterium]